MALIQSYSRYYHDSTKYAVDRLGGAPLDWAMQPEPFKDIVTKRKIDLSQYLPFRENQFNPSLPSGQKDDATAQEIGPARLSRLLYFTNGVTRIVNTALTAKPLRFLMRAAPSAGGLYPTEIYVAVRANRHFASGIYNYQVRDHSIIPLWDGDEWKAFEKYCFSHAALAEADLLVLLSVLPFRSSWRYKERGYRRCLLDTGHVLGNLVAYGQREGFAPEVIGGFWDSAFNGHLFFDDREEVLLGAVAMPLMAGRAAPTPKPTPASAEAAPASAATLTRETGGSPHAPHAATGAPAGYRAAALRSPPRELPDLATIPTDQISLHLHRLANIEGPLDPSMVLDLVPPPLAAEDGNSAGGANRTSAGAGLPPPSLLTAPRDQSAWRHELGATLLLRRSTRGYTGGAIALEYLAALLAYGYACYPPTGPTGPVGPAAATDPSAAEVASVAQSAQNRLFAPEVLETFVLALNVGNLEPGAYRYDPASQRLTAVRLGQFRGQAHHLCLQQDLGRDAAALVVHAMDLDRGLERYGERVYRYAHMDSGHLGQRLNLAAIAMDLGVSGIGGFFDDEVNLLFDLPPSYIVTYLTTLGQPV
ncbi:MAG: SagB/ThcOx family dehydrogenase [Planctomycetota bacterium]